MWQTEWDLNVSLKIFFAYSHTHTHANFGLKGDFYGGKNAHIFNKKHHFLKSPNKFFLL